MACTITKKMSDNMCYHGKKTDKMCYNNKQIDSMCYHRKRQIICAIME